MIIIVSDITGRTLNYDYALCGAIRKYLSTTDIIEFWGPNQGKDQGFPIRSFGTLVPNRYKTYSNTFIRILKAFDTILAYSRIVFRIARLKPEVFHLQWFPFLSLGTRGASIDMFFVRMIKRVSRQTHIVFTIHNMCPHGMPENDRARYNSVFKKALEFFDHFVVHTERTKEEVIEAFELEMDKVSLVYHGVFTPKGIIFDRKPWNDSKVKLIMYGSQNWYKGTDVFVESLSLLPYEIKERIEVNICGCIDQETSNKCKLIDSGCKINWMSYYLDDELLYKMISESDIILLPYRRISQSGVLLLALATKRFIITSNLPTFKETLKGYEDDMFFESENPVSLSTLICKYINGNINRDRTLDTLESLSKLYSWDESAKRTITIYNEIKGC